MNLAVVEAPQSANGTDAETTSTDRTEKLHNLILKNYSTLTAAAYAAWSDLIVFDAERIIGNLISNLDRYTGPAEQKFFLRWASRFVAKETRRYKITAHILSEHEKLLIAAIREYTWTSSADYAIEPQDLYWEIAFLIFQRAHSLAKPGKAKLTTRLTALVKKHVYLSYNAKNRRRQRLAAENAEAIECEQLSREELASMRADDEPNSLIQTIFG